MQFIFNNENGVNANAFILTNYSHKGKIRYVKNEKDFETKYIFDNQGYLCKIIDANGNTTTFTYNSLGLVKIATYPSENTNSVYYKEYSYDLVGNLERKLNSNDNIVKMIFYTYDQKGRLLSKTESDINSDNSI